jgi:hypothetical protein
MVFMLLALGAALVSGLLVCDYCQKQMYLAIALSEVSMCLAIASLEVSLEEYSSEVLSEEY